MTLAEARERFVVQGIDNAFLDSRAAEQEVAFKNCICMLEGVAMTKTIRRHHSSYGLKHYVEDPANMFSQTSSDPSTYTGYVYEGTLILAALSLGFTCDYIGIKYMSCRFNINEKSLRRKVKQLLEDGRIAAKERKEVAESTSFGER